MSGGIVYLVQPSELVGTNRYKIGMSTKNSLQRCTNGYKKGSRFLHIVEHSNPQSTEKKLINIFKKNYKNIAGNEYFEGCENDMIIDFLKIVTGLYIKRKSPENITVTESENTTENVTNNITENITNNITNIVSESVNNQIKIKNIDQDIGLKKFICDTCKKVFNHKGHYNVHINKKKKCKSPALKCLNCDRSFSSKSNLNRHIRQFNNCYIKNNNIDEIKQLEIKLLELKLNNIKNN